MTESSQKETYKYVCKVCDYKTSKKSNYEKHLTSDKHKNMEVNDKNDDNDNKSHINSNNIHTFSKKKFQCINCGKKYAHRQGLFVHKKKCKTINENIKGNTETTDKQIITMLIKENTELKNFIMNILKKDI